MSRITVALLVAFATESQGRDHRPNVVSGMHVNATYLASERRSSGKAGLPAGSLRGATLQEVHSEVSQETKALETTEKELEGKKQQLRRANSTNVKVLQVAQAIRGKFNSTVTEINQQVSLKDQAIAQLTSQLQAARGQLNKSLLQEQELNSEKYKLATMIQQAQGDRVDGSDTAVELQRELDQEDHLFNNEKNKSGLFQDAAKVASMKLKDTDTKLSLAIAKLNASKLARANSDAQYNGTLVELSKVTAIERSLQTQLKHLRERQRDEAHSSLATIELSAMADVLG